MPGGQLSFCLRGLFNLGRSAHNPNISLASSKVGVCSLKCYILCTSAGLTRPVCIFLLFPPLRECHPHTPRSSSRLRGLKELILAAMAWEKMVGLSQYPWGNLVKVYLFPSCVNANQYWLSGCIGIEKNALLKSTTVKCCSLAFREFSNVWGSGTHGARCITASFNVCRSWTILHPVQGASFFYQEYWGIARWLFTLENYSSLLKSSITGMIPSLTSGLRGYCHFVLWSLVLLFSAFLRQLGL